MDYWGCINPFPKPIIQGKDLEPCRGLVRGKSTEMEYAAIATANYMRTSHIPAQRVDIDGQAKGWYGGIDKEKDCCKWGLHVHIRPFRSKG
jgi:hypothetical protein